MSKQKISFVFLLNKRSPKDAAWKAEIFATLFLENKLQINKNNYETMFLFMSKQVTLPKVSLTCKK